VLEPLRLDRRRVQCYWLIWHISPSQFGVLSLLLDYFFDFLLFLCEVQPNHVHDSLLVLIEFGVFHNYLVIFACEFLELLFFYF
jgi:hypothetical protein